MMKEREVTKRNVFILEQLEFEAEVNTQRSDKINVEDKFRDLLKAFPKPIKHPQLFSPDKEQRIENKENLPKKEISIIVGGDKTDSTMLKTNEQPKRPHRRPRIINESICSIQRPIHQPGLMQKKEAEKKTKEDQPQSEFVLKHRIRFNRANRLVIDRYIQNPSSFSAFGDEFNVLINKAKMYNEDCVMNQKKTIGFDSLYEEFNKDKFSGILNTDSEEDITSFPSQLKIFSSNFKQFLKHKRSHPEISSIL